MTKRLSKLPRTGLSGVLLAWCWLAPAAAADGVLALAAGAYDVGDFEAETAEAGLELRLSTVGRGAVPQRWRLRPIVGVAGTSDGAFWGYAGLALEMEAGGRWLAVPSFAVALFEPGDGKDLGGAVEFRSGIEVAYRVGEASRLGLLFHHLSNAGIYDDNPGSNSLTLVFSRRLGGR